MRRLPMPLATLLSVLLAFIGTFTTAPASGATVAVAPEPGTEHNYVCPHADGKAALECYFDAVQHLYTMCRNVKSIEIIEFGYENSREGVNAAKTEYCLDKQKQNIARPFKAALREAGKKKQVVEGLNKLQELWLSAMGQIHWRSGESDNDYKARVAKPYDEFNDRITSIRTSFAATETPPAPTRTAKAGKPKPGAKAKKH